MIRLQRGILKGTLIKTTKDFRLSRPLLSRVRVAIMDKLYPYLKTGEVVVYDIFSGTGSFGIEALSCGAKKCIFIENNQECLKLLKSNIENLSLQGQAYIYNIDILNCDNFFATQEFSSPTIIFMGPPYKYFKEEYYLGALKNVIEESLFFIDSGKILFTIVQCEKKFNHVDLLPSAYKGKINMDIRKYGRTVIVYFSKS